MHPSCDVFMSLSVCAFLSDIVYAVSSYSTSVCVRIPQLHLSIYLQIGTCTYIKATESMYLPVGVCLSSTRLSVVATLCILTYWQLHLFVYATIGCRICVCMYLSVAASVCVCTYR